MIYQITEAQRQQLLDSAYAGGHDIGAAKLLQSLAPVDAEAVGYINEMDDPVLFNDKPGRPDKRRKEAAVCVGSGWQYLYTHPAPLRELSDEEIKDIATEHIGTAFINEMAFARAVLRKAGEK